MLVKSTVIFLDFQTPLVFVEITHQFPNNDLITMMPSNDAYVNANCENPDQTAPLAV